MNAGIRFKRTLLISDRILHLVVGPVGVGKTTYSNQIAQTSRAVVFSIDQYMSILFQPDLAGDVDIKTMNPTWFTERVDRCESVIYGGAEKVLDAGCDVVLDLGFIRKARRETALHFAERTGVRHQIHYLTAESAVRQSRIEKRNLERGPTYSMAVSPQMFAFAEMMFEPPEGHELTGALVVDTSTNDSPPIA